MRSVSASRRAMLIWRSGLKWIWRHWESIRRKPYWISMFKSDLLTPVGHWYQPSRKSVMPKLWSIFEKNSWVEGTKCLFDCPWRSLFPDSTQDRGKNVFILLFRWRVQAPSKFPMKSIRRYLSHVCGCVVFMSEYCTSKVAKSRLCYCDLTLLVELCGRSRHHEPLTIQPIRLRFLSRLFSLDEYGRDGFIRDRRQRHQYGRVWRIQPGLFTYLLDLA